MKQYNSKHSGTLSTRGFYTIMASCGIIIAISAWVIWSSFSDEAPVAMEQSNPIIAPVEIPPSLEPSLSVSAEETFPSTEVETQAEDTTESASQESSDAQTVSAPVFVHPVSGGVVTPFSGDELLFQPTFGDWRAHTGCDFSAAPGEPVLSITDGTILSVYDDALYGQTVSIEHSADLITTYSGLVDIRVDAGDWVLAGEAIGTVAESIPAEEALGAHVHVEAKRGDAAIDVVELFGDEISE